MTFEASVIERAVSNRITVDNAVAEIRNATGKYSNYSLNNDLRKLADDTNPDETLRDTALRYLQNTRAGIPRELIDGILRYKLPEAPKTFFALYASSVRAGCEFEAFKTRLADHLTHHGIPTAVLTDRTAWQQHEAFLQSRLVHARGTNGNVSIFLSPDFIEELRSPSTVTLPQNPTPIHREASPRQTPTPPLKIETASAAQQRARELITQFDALREAEITNSISPSSYSDPAIETYINRLRLMLDGVDPWNETRAQQDIVYLYRAYQRRQNEIDNPASIRSERPQRHIGTVPMEDHVWKTEQQRFLKRLKNVIPRLYGEELRNADALHQSITAHTSADHVNGQSWHKQIAELERSVSNNT